MDVVAFFIGLVVLLSVSAVGRWLLYMVFGLSTKDEDFEDRMLGWFMGTIVGWLLVLFGLAALAIGFYVLGQVGCA